MRILIILFITCCFSTIKGQINFYKTFSGNGYDKAEGIVQLKDSSYTITGSSSSWSGNSDAFLLHLDSLGNYKWSRNYGGNESDIGRRVLFDSTAGYFIAGYSNSFSGDGNFDAFLINIDINGNELWNKAYSKTSSWERINDAILTTDSGIIMVGETVTTDNDNSDVFIIKTTFDGDTLWTKTIGGIGKDFANSVVKLNNNYLVGGQYFIPDSNLVKGFVMEISDQGTVLRFDTIGNYSGNYYVTDLSIGIGKYYVAGYRESSTLINEYYGIFDLNGSLLNQYTYDYPDVKTKVNQMAYIPTTNLVAIGYQTINPFSNQDAFDVSYAYYTPENLYYLSQSFSAGISNFGLDQLNDLIPTSDGAFIIVGFNSIIDDGIAQPNGGNNLFVAKVGPDYTFPSALNTVLNELVSLDETPINNYVHLFPNPFQESIEIQLANNIPTNAVLVNQIGQQVWSGKITGKTEINTSDYPSGFYILQIDSTNYKLIKW